MSNKVTVANRSIWLYFYLDSTMRCESKLHTPLFEALENQCYKRPLTFIRFSFILSVDIIFSIWIQMQMKMNLFKNQFIFLDSFYSRGHWLQNSFMTGLISRLMTTRVNVRSWEKKAKVFFRKFFRMRSMRHSWILALWSWHREFLMHWIAPLQSLFIEKPLEKIFNWTKTLWEPLVTPHSIMVNLLPFLCFPSWIDVSIWLMLGITFSQNPIKPDERVSLKVIDTDDSGQWLGSLAIGKRWTNVENESSQPKIFSPRFYSNRSEYNPANRPSTDIVT